MTMLAMGIASELWARAKEIAARNPAHRARILGLPRLTITDAPKTSIVVDCRTGERMVTRLPPDPPPPISRGELRAIMLRALTDAEDDRKTRDTRPAMPAILRAVSEATGVAIADIIFTPFWRRSWAISNARHLYYYLALHIRPELSFRAFAESLPNVPHHASIGEGIAAFQKKRERRADMQAICRHPLIAPLLAQADQTQRIKRASPRNVLRPPVNVSRKPKGQRPYDLYRRALGLRQQAPSMEFRAGV